jgi:predicted GNAT family acetyltransferase
MYNDIPLINNEADHEFEMIVDGSRAFIDYLQRGDTFLLIHTEVPEALQGHGLAAALVEKTFRYLEANGFKMRPYCEYVQAYLQRHHEWERLLA